MSSDKCGACGKFRGVHGGIRGGEKNEYERAQAKDAYHAAKRRFQSFIAQFSFYQSYSDSDLEQISVMEREIARCRKTYDYYMHMAEGGSYDGHENPQCHCELCVEDGYVR